MDKGRLREHYKKIRKHLPEARRKEARDTLWDYLEGRLSGLEKILSFVSMKYEVDLSLVNQILLQEGRLYLPKIEGDHLIAYPVKDLEKDHCTQQEDRFDCILVPGIAFDERLYRLGYGFGYYDRFLACHKDSLSIGIGFREQLAGEPLPTEEHDEPVRELCLV